MARKKPPEHHEEHADETWLIPYADLLTLLLALFIVLFGVSQLDTEKYKQVMASFESAFNPLQTTGGGGGQFGVLPPGSVPPPPPSAPPDSSPENREAAQFRSLRARMERYIHTNQLSQDLEVTMLDQGMLIRIRDRALFDSGSAIMRAESLPVADEIAGLLVPLSQPIIISGYTDTVPINTYEFPTNWDLSSKRALNFMKYILARQPALAPERFSAIGYGEYRPLESNATEEGRAKNRRVEVLILKQYQDVTPRRDGVFPQNPVVPMTPPVPSASGGGQGSTVGGTP